MADGSQSVAADDSFASILIACGVLTASGFERANRIHHETGDRLAATLIKLGLISESDMVEAFATWLDVPKFFSTDYPSQSVFISELSPSFFRAAQAVPIETAESVSLVLADPSDTFTLRAVEFATGRKAKRFVARTSEVEALLDKLFPISGDDGRDAEPHSIVDSEGEIEHLRELASDAPVIRLVSRLITGAVERRASDIHIEPLEAGIKVRYRIDGKLHDVETPPARLKSAIVSRIKIMAKLDIAERRLAQDGRLSFPVAGKNIDFRVSTSPTVYGESVVLRILDRQDVSLDFEELGFEGRNLSLIIAALQRPHGIVLVTGPTGSGKTTTLYSALKLLNTPDKKILTVEDPVEYMLDGVNQVQVQPSIGLTFANTLRSFLRQDPDIMMVGEIRDAETAKIAVQAALTGHLVLATLHTNDAASSLTRMVDMGVEDYLLASTVNLAIGQRLVRRLCPTCATESSTRPAETEMFTQAGIEPPPALLRQKGCNECQGTGFLRRIAISEVMEVSSPIRDMLTKGTDSFAIEETAIAEGMYSMLTDGLHKVARGQTALNEVLRATRDE